MFLNIFKFLQNENDSDNLNNSAARFVENYFEIMQKDEIVKFSEMFEYLKNYSPVHNVKKGVQYPATLVTTADHDDRVVPAHSFKFAAELQDKQAGDNPVLIRIDVNAGHGAGKSVAATIQENVDMQVFTLYNMGVKELK